MMRRGLFLPEKRLQNKNVDSRKKSCYLMANLISQTANVISGGTE